MKIKVKLENGSVLTERDEVTNTFGLNSLKVC